MDTGSQKKVTWSQPLIFDKRYFEKEFQHQDPWRLDGSDAQQKKYHRQIEVLDKFIRDPGAILEIGCAEGLHTRMLAETYPRAKIVALDISSSALARTEERCCGLTNIQYVEGDANRLLRGRSLPGYPYDAILQSETLYYMFTNHVLHLSLHSYVKGLLGTLTPRGVFLTCNSYAGITRAVMAAYYASLGTTGHTVYARTYREWFDSQKAYWTYEVRCYRAGRPAAEAARTRRHKAQLTAPDGRS